MAVNTNLQIPFNPAEGISGQILGAIQAANEMYMRQKQLALQSGQLGVEQQRAGIQQQEANTGQAAQQSTAQLQGLQGQQLQQQMSIEQLMLQMKQREMGYVFGVPGSGGHATATTDTGQGGLAGDAENTKSRLNLNNDEAAQYDQAVKSVQANFLSEGKLNTDPIDQAIKSILQRRGETARDLHPTLRQTPDGQWFQDMHTANGAVAYSAPIPVPREYLGTTTEGVDYMRTVNPNTGEVTVTPIETSKVTTPNLIGSNPGATQAGGTIKTANAGGLKLPYGGASFQLPGAAKKLSEPGQSMITGLTQANNMTDGVLNFIGNKKPGYLDWQKARLEYSMGMNPGADYADAFQAIGLMRSVATGPLLHGIRNPAIIQGIQDHLPSLGDSPSLIQQKIKDLKPFWNQAIQDVYHTENLAAPGESATSPAVPTQVAGQPAQPAAKPAGKAPAKAGSHPFFDQFGGAPLQ